MSSFIERLQEEIGYSPDEDGSVDDLIAYKDALEDALASVIEAAREGRDESQRDLDTYDVPGEWQDSDGSWKDWDSECAARETEAARDAYARVLRVVEP